MKLTTKSRFHGAQTRGQAGYNMGKINRLTSDWVTGGHISNDAHLYSTLLTMRQRSRDLARNDDYVKSFIRLGKANIIGPEGVRLQMDVTDSQGGSDVQANDAVEAAWKMWSSRKYCCTDRRTSRLEMENLAVETMLRDGTFIAEKVKFFENDFAFALRPIEIDYLDEDRCEVLSSGNTVRMGVETNAWGEHVAYWLRTRNPGDLYFAGPKGGSFRSERYEANRFVFVMLRQFIEQSQGIPETHTAGTRIKMASGYEDAAVDSARGAACKSIYFKQSIEAGGSGYKGNAVDAQGRYLDDMAPGQKEQLPPGVEPVSIDPVFPHADHKAFMQVTLRGIAAGLGISYNALAGDYSDVNYSSLRAAALQDRDLYMLLQSLVIGQLHSDIFPDWLEMALTTGQVMFLGGRKATLGQFDKLNKPKFKGRRWSWVDPEKDVNASEKALKLKIKAPSDIVSEDGGDYDDTMRRIDKDNQVARDYGVPVNVDEIKVQLDIYGIAVRAGAITPTMEDEEKLREKLGYPPLSAEAKKQWKETPRIPITLQNQSQIQGQTPGAFGGGQEPNSDDEEK